MPTPKIGSIVTYYTHEASNNIHTTLDALGIVMAATEHFIELKVIKSGILPYDVKAVEFDAAAYNKLPVAERQVGLSYWRPLDSKAPDFAAVFKPLSPAETAAELKARELEALKAKQHKELLDLGLVSNKAVMDARHKAELEDFEAKHKPGGNPTNVLPGMPVPPVVPAPSSVPSTFVSPTRQDPTSRILLNTLEPTLESPHPNLNPTRGPSSFDPPLKPSHPASDFSL